MPDTVETLILDLLEWIGPEGKTYVSVMDAWRTSCPRLPVWEDANDRGFVERLYVEGQGAFVSLTEGGIHHLAMHGRSTRRVRRSRAQGSHSQ